jgi:hypothetical protein
MRHGKAKPSSLTSCHYRRHRAYKNFERVEGWHKVILHPKAA